MKDRTHSPAEAYYVMEQLINPNWLTQNAHNIHLDTVQMTVTGLDGIQTRWYFTERDARAMASKLSARPEVRFKIDA